MFDTLLLLLYTNVLAYSIILNAWHLTNQARVDAIQDSGLRVGGIRDLFFQDLLQDRGQVVLIA